MWIILSGGRIDGKYGYLNALRSQNMVECDCV